MKKLILLLLFIPLVSFGQTKDGEIKTYYESGELKSTGNYVNGLEQGEYKFYYESGQLKMEGVYADIDSLEFLLGKVIWQKGSSRDYYVGVTFEGVYFDDEKNKIDAYRKATEKPIKDGKWIYYYESGKIEKEEFYEDNLILKTIYYSEKGFKTSKIEYGLKEGWLLAEETKYYKNGTIKSEDFGGYEGSYSAKYYENGQMEWEDWGDGLIKTYYKNGQIKTITITEGFNFNYELIQEYSETGKLTKEEICLSSQLQKQFKLGIWINGKDIFEKDYQLNPSKDVRERCYKNKLL